MKTSLVALLALFGSIHAFAADVPKVGDPAPAFELKTYEGHSFKLADRKGKWTVLYFYPKADTPGCTKQACAYRDSIKAITKLGAEVYGISADNVEDIKKFHEKYHLNFTLLADPDAKTIEAYGVKRLGIPFAKRWTFIVDPKLDVQRVFPDVDPVKDAGNVAKAIQELQQKK